MSLVTGGFARLTIDSSGTITIPNNGNLTVSGNLTVTGELDSGNQLALILALG